MELEERKRSRQTDANVRAKAIGTRTLKEGRERWSSPHLSLRHYPCIRPVLPPRWSRFFPNSVLLRILHVVVRVHTVCPRVVARHVPAKSQRLMVTVLPASCQQAHFHFFIFHVLIFIIFVVSVCSFPFFQFFHALSFLIFFVSVCVLIFPFSKKKKKSCLDVFSPNHPTQQPTQHQTQHPTQHQTQQPTQHQTHHPTRRRCAMGPNPDPSKTAVWEKSPNVSAVVHISDADADSIECLSFRAHFCCFVSNDLVPVLRLRLHVMGMAQIWSPREQQSSNPKPCLRASGTPQPLSLSLPPGSFLLTPPSLLHTLPPPPSSFPDLFCDTLPPFLYAKASHLASVSRGRCLHEVIASCLSCGAPA